MSIVLKDQTRLLIKNKWRYTVKYFVVTYGCQMNVHESEKIAAILENMGYSLAPDRENADIIVFNTCAIREGAEDRVFGNVGNLKRLKKKNKDLIIAVCGCMTQKEQTAQKLMQKFPFIDIVIGTFNIPKLQYYIEAVQKGRQFELLNEGELDEILPYKRFAKITLSPLSNPLRTFVGLLSIATYSLPCS